MEKRIKAFAQELRSNGTKEEKRLWYDFLRNCPVQFRRQVPFGPYILDFYCAQKNWVLKWMGLSITQTEALTMMQKENRNCSRPTGSGSFDLQILKYGINLRVFVPEFSRK